MSYMPPTNPLRETEHRPWPLPAGGWIMSQWWRDLLFAHWPVPADCVTRLLPASIDVEQFDGSAWIGVVPFRMDGIRARLLPPLPGCSAFAEANVRTYVRHGGRSGVWFFSLDAAHRLAVAAARRLFHLPYYHARMRCRRAGETVDYRSVRHRGEAELIARYRPTGPVEPAAPGTLEHFLVERYCLFTADRGGRIRRGDIHHVRWPLQPAEAEIETDTLAAAAGIVLPDTAPLLHYADAIQALVWPLAGAEG